MIDICYSLASVRQLETTAGTARAEAPEGARDAVGAHVRPQRAWTARGSSPFLVWCIARIAFASRNPSSKYEYRLVEGALS